MSETQATMSPASDPHGTAPANEHDAGHDHQGDAAPLGPPDLMAWTYAIAGGIVGIVVAGALYIAGGA